MTTNVLAGVAVMGLGDDMRLTNTHLPAASFVCANCGTIWTLSTQVVRNFVDPSVPSVRS
jgi:L-fucose mutarotase/ribose pyranase (RbsD/FucU family)